MQQNTKKWERIPQICSNRRASNSSVDYMNIKTVFVTMHCNKQVIETNMQWYLGILSALLKVNEYNKMIEMLSLDHDYSINILNG